jgi:hypothetical protein
MKHNRPDYDRIQDPDSLRNVGKCTVDLTADPDPQE